MNPTKTVIAVLLALGSAGAPGQNQPAPQPPASKPVDDSASYGPVLNPQTPPSTTVQPTTSSTHAAGEARPQAQEERAGLPPASKQTEVDPSARPAPAAVQPEPAQETRQQGTRQPPRQPQQQQRPPQANRRAVEQRIDGTPRIVAPASKPAPSVPAPVASRPVGPQTSQLTGCAGGLCSDANGNTYNASGPGNAGVSRDGRLCTGNGVTVQCL